MSKVKNGNYGTFESCGINEAVKAHCKRNHIQLKLFFRETLHLHSSDWWGSVCRSGYADEIELKTICREVGYDFKKLHFVEGGTNDKVEKGKSIARERANKKSQKAPSENYQQLTLVMENNHPDVTKMDDSQLYETLGFKRIKSLYLYSLYKESKK